MGPFKKRKNSGTKDILFVTESIDASLTHCLAGLEDAQRARIEILYFSDFVNRGLYRILNNIQYVVFVRSLQPSIRLARIIRFLKIPYFYFTDDNFFALQNRQPGPEEKNFLGGAKAILNTTENLLDYFKQYNKNPGAILKPTLPKRSERPGQQAPDNDSASLNLFFGSNGRSDGFFRLIPYFNELSKKFNVELTVAARDVEFEQVRQMLKPEISLIFLPFELDFEKFIQGLQGRKIDFFLHPRGFNAEIVRNYDFKTLSFCMVPFRANGIPLFPNLNIYNLAFKNHSVLASSILYKDEHDFLDKLLRIKNDAKLKAEITSSLKRFCETEFASNSNDFTLMSNFRPLESSCKSRVIKILKLLSLELGRITIRAVRSLKQRRPF